MFLWQKYKYNVVYLGEDEDFIALENNFNTVKPEIVAWDTETDGLHIMTAKPFLIGFGFDKYLYIYEPTKWRNEFLFALVSKPFVKYFVAHNTKFDYHMMINFGTPIPRTVPLADTLAMARLTNYADSMDGIGLASLGARLVDPTSKFAADVIRTHINELNKERYNFIKEYVKENDVGMSYTAFKELWEKRIQYIPHELDEHLDKMPQKANYHDSYLDRPNLMINYLADDILLVLEVMEKLIPVLDHVDVGRRTWHRENKLISVVGDFERNGMPIDVDYIKESRLKVIDYIDEVYSKLWAIADVKNIPTLDDPKKDLLFNKNHQFSVGQHAVIKEIVSRKYRIGMLKSDSDALEELIDMSKDTKSGYPEEVGIFAGYIVELRTLGKWLSTYIEGMLNRLVDGRLYTDINNSGAITGRVSSDLQQQPNGGLYTADGVELFHPRKPFINDEGFRHFYLDFSNMEMRVQAYYTMITSTGDLNMCRAFMPFECTNMFTGEKFDPVKDLDKWNSGEWVDEEGQIWNKLDLHAETTKKAFPHIPVEDPEFKAHYRELGKRANFLKNYGGGIGALESQLKVSNEIAKALDSGYYSAFPKILDYQSSVENDIMSKGYTENLYGRRYYFQDTRFAYRGYNYNVQGSCADYVKEKEIELDDFLKDYESKMIMPIHDEIVFSIKIGEEHIVPELKRIMENSKEFMPSLPMVSDVEYTDTNWHDKKEWVI